MAADVLLKKSFIIQNAIMASTDSIGKFGRLVYLLCPDIVPYSFTYWLLHVNYKCFALSVCPEAYPLF